MDLFKILDGTPEPPIVALHTGQNTSGDYWLPVPMNDYQKELTDRVISLHYSDILKYFETDDKDQLLLDSLKTLYLNSQLVATHPFLLIKQYLPKSLSAKDVPYNLAATSGKFQVLKDVLALIEDTALNVAIVARSGKTLDLIEALLLGSRCNIRRATGNHVKDPVKHSKQVGIRTLNTYIISSTASENKLHDTKKFDLVFSFDITTEIELLKSLRARDDTPILRFVTSNSIDHVALYFRQLHKERSREYLVDVTAATVVLRDRVGVLPPDLRPIYSKNLSYMRDWFHDFLKQPWPLPELPKIRKYDSLDVERSLLTEVIFEKKDQSQEEKKSLYELKRLNKDYSVNPLKDSDTGIQQTNSNYNETLTHKLIQEFNLVRHDLDLQEQSFRNFEQLKENSNDFLKQDEVKLMEELIDYKQRISIVTTKTEKLSKEIEERKQEIIHLKEANEGDKIRSLKEQIMQETRKLESHSTEKQYMEKEINNAKNSIIESKEDINKIKVKISENEKNLENYFNGFKDDHVVDDEFKQVQQKLRNLKIEIEQNLSKLKTSRSR